MKKTMTQSAALVAVLVLACASAFAQTVGGPVTAQPVVGGSSTTTSATMNCAADRLFAAVWSTSQIWDFCTGPDGAPMGFPLAPAPNASQLWQDTSGVLTVYAGSADLQQFLVTHGQSSYVFKGDWTVVPNGRLVAAQGGMVTATFSSLNRTLQFNLNSDGSVYQTNQPQTEPNYQVGARNAAGFYGLASNATLYFHERYLGEYSPAIQVPLGGQTVAAVASPSDGSSVVYVATQPHFACSKDTGACQADAPGAVYKISYDRYAAANPFSIRLVVSGVYPYTNWSATTMVGTETSVYLIEQHPTAGYRIYGYSNQGGSSRAFVIDKNVVGIRDYQGNIFDPQFNALALANH